MLSSEDKAIDFICEEQKARKSYAMENELIEELDGEYSRVDLSYLEKGLSAKTFGLAILTTIGMKKLLTQKQLWIAGTLGAIAHSIGQMIVAVWVTGTPSIAVYLPIMVAVSILTGSFTGLSAQFLVNRGKLWKTIFR